MGLPSEPVGGPDDELIIVGDRVLIDPQEGEGRTAAGLILPANAVEKNPVQGGRIKAVGPGTPVADPASFEDEPWKAGGTEPRYLPQQAKVGDYAIFFRKAGVEIEYRGTSYMVVPQSAILVLVRSPEGEPPGRDEVPDSWPA